jgi:hypothetical protein
MALTPISADLLLSWASVKSAPRGSAATNASATNAASGVKAPWEDTKHLTPASTLVSQALAGKTFFDDSSKTFTGANADERKLFALHSGLNSLSALVGRYDQKGVATAEQDRLAKAFDAGLKQLDSFLAGAKFEAFSVVRGALSSQALSGAAVAETRREYTTGVVARGDPDIANGAFSGPLSFHVDTTPITGSAQSFDIDLADMGAMPRSLNNVVNFINSKLRAAGLTSAFKAVKQGAAGAVGGDQYTLKLTITSGEKVSFSANTAAPAVYLASAAGQITKLADPDGAIATPPQNAPNVAFDKLAAQGVTLKSSAASADGSLYVLADASGTVNGQPVKGAGDVALMKYDSAGNLLYTRTLGADGAAAGLSLAVAADGKVAIAGSISGSLTDGGTAAATGNDSFVTLFNEDGVEQWTKREKNARDGEASAAAFGTDGSVYVASRQKSDSGDWDAALTAYGADGTARGTQLISGAGDQSPRAIAVQDLGGGVQRVTLANVEGAKLILRQFDDNGAALSAGDTRDLGSLAGGDVSGLVVDGSDLYVAGTTKGGGLNAGAVARAYSGGQDGFVAKIGADLVAAGSDQVSYIGGAGDETIAGVSVQAGQVYVGGDSTAAFAGQTALRERDGFVARLDASGILDWTQRVAGGKDYAARGFAVDGLGASALDRLGLPQGEAAFKDVADLVSTTSLRAGDQFSVSVNGHGAQTITIKADDTLQTLADRVEKIILSAGAASVQLSTAGDKFKIVPSANAKIELHAGPAGKDALAGLGLSEGVVMQTPDLTKKTHPPPVYGLGLSSLLSLTDKLGRKEASDAISAAMQTVQKAFRALSAPPASATPTGTAPAYLKKQLANYQAALARLSA